MKVNFNYINKKVWIVAIFMIIFALVAIPYLPSQIPCQWNGNGDVINKTNKFVILLFPIISIAIIVLGNLVATIDPKQIAYQKAKREYNLICSIVIISLLIIQVYVILHASGIITESSKFSLIDIIPGIVIMIVGNYLPKFPQNYLTGVKTVWAYSSQDIWRKTQRFSSKLWIVCGFVMMINGLLFQIRIREVNILLIISMIALPRIYGFIEHYKTIK